MTGTLASALMRSIRPLPPRGMTTSTYCGMVISWPTAARSVVCTSCTASTGKPLSVRACCTRRAKALLESIASEPPRKMQALPLLIDRLAASMVTLGRLSKIMPNTPIGTRIWPTRMPLGTCFMPRISPITSGMAANCSQPWAQVSSTWGVNFRRSTIGSASPAARARSRSLALSSCKASVFSRSKAARRRKAMFLVAAEALAISADAFLACWPRDCMCSVVFSSVMRSFSQKPKTLWPHPAMRMPVIGRWRR